MVNDLERQQFLAALATTLATVANKLTFPPDRIDLSTNRAHIDRLEDQLDEMRNATDMWDETEKPVIEGMPQTVCLRFMLASLINDRAITVSGLIKTVEEHHPGWIETRAYEFLDAWGIVWDLNMTGGINTLYRAVDS